MNTYHKFAPNVFVAKSTERYVKDETIILTTKYGKEHECIVFKYSDVFIILRIMPKGV